MGAIVETCVRCRLDKVRSADLCVGCQLVLKQDRILELERQYIVDTHFLKQRVDDLERQLRRSMGLST